MARLTSKKLDQIHRKLLKEAQSLGRMVDGIPVYRLHYDRSITPKQAAKLQAILLAVR